MQHYMQNATISAKYSIQISTKSQGTKQAMKCAKQASICPTFPHTHTDFSHTLTRFLAAHFHQNFQQFNPSFPTIIQPQKHPRIIALHARNNYLTRAKLTNNLTTRIKHSILPLKPNLKAENSQLLNQKITSCWSLLRVG